MSRPIRNEQPRHKRRGIKTEEHCKSVRPKGRGIEPGEIECPNALYHITLRPARGYLRGDEDRLAFLKTWENVVGQFNWLCYAWCPMDNHYHLLVQTPRWGEL